MGKAKLPTIRKSEETQTKIRSFANENMTLEIKENHFLIRLSGTDEIIKLTFAEVPVLNSIVCEKQLVSMKIPSSVISRIRRNIKEVSS